MAHIITLRGIQDRSYSKNYKEVKIVLNRFIIDMGFGPRIHGQFRISPMSPQYYMAFYYVGPIIKSKNCKDKFQLFTEDSLFHHNRASVSDLKIDLDL